MFKLINSLTVNSRLRVISILILIFSFACVFLLWNTSHSFDKDVKEINELTELELKVWQIRNNYNSMRGDMMQVFIADPLTQQNYVKQASDLLNERIEQIHESSAGIKTDKMDINAVSAYNEFNSSLHDYIAFCSENLPAIQKVQLNDSVQFNHLRNVLVVDLDRHFLVLREHAIKVIDLVHQHKLNVLNGMDQQRKQSLLFTIILSVSLLAITIYIIIVISKSITSPIRETEQILQILSSGDLPEIKEYNGKDEFSRMLRSLKLFNSHIHLLMDFVRNVAQNNFTVHAQMFDGRGPIAASLVSMRDNLQVAYTSESQRAWSSKGLADLGELIRRQDNSITMYEKMLSFIVKYLSVNQGALYIHDEKDNSLELVAAYAYGRKKHISSSIKEGEGLAGQAFLERESILLKEVPREYIKITSGLGEAPPRMLVISPLITNDQVYGVLELASFSEFDTHKIEFIKKVSEELAAVIKSTQVSTKTKELLQASQQQAEELKAQEEEMRQNMEELQATQEGMGRMLKEVQQKENIFNELLDAIHSPILVFDDQYKVIQVNSSMKNSYAAIGLPIHIGSNLLHIPKEEATEQKLIYDRALKGEVFYAEHKIKSSPNGAKFHYSGIRSSEGIITSVVVISERVSLMSI